MLDRIDNLLDRITMYRLVLYFLAALLVIAAAFGAIGWLPYGPMAIAFSTAVLLFAAWASNGILANVFGAVPNAESSWITALILALIITPVVPAFGGASGAAAAGGIAFLFWAAVLAMASKYVLAFKKKHFFNPAALAVAVTALAMNQAASWWVGGNLPLMPFVIAGGLLVIRKIRRFDLATAFTAAALVSVAATNASFENPLTAVMQAMIHAPLFFFAAIMITEPATTPPTRRRRIAYGALVGLLFAPAVHVGSIYSTPELALLAGNVLSWLISPKAKYVFALKKKEEVGAGIYDFVLSPTGGPGASAHAMDFLPGQYMEWTLAHDRPDSRGNRRYFTIASSPTERDMRIGVRFYDPPSSFKKRLMKLERGGRIAGGSLAGDFTMPRNTREKLAFLAGGIGITPFRSMAKYMSDKGERRDAVLLYSNRTESEIAYREVFDEAARRSGLKTIYAITGAAEAAERGSDLPPNFHFGRIDARFVAKAVPDWRERTFYVSGSHALVESFEKMLAELGVDKRRIKTDFFPGFA